MMKHLLIPVALTLVFTACQNAEVGEKKASDGETIYFDYQVRAEEDRNEATVRLQYRAGGKEGQPILLEDPSRVLFDNVPLEADSSRFMGAYYELTEPLQDFRGEHSIVFIDKNQKEHRQAFQFTPFTLAEELPERLPKKPFTIRLKDFPTGPTPIRLVMIDASHESADVNEELEIRNAEISIDSTLLANLTKGPIVMEIYREEERPVRNGATAGGLFSLTYGIKRNFEFVR